MLAFITCLVIRSSKKFVLLRQGYILSCTDYHVCCVRNKKNKDLTKGGLISPLKSGMKIYLNQSCFLRFYLFLERGRERKREGEKHQCELPLTLPLLGTWPATQACTLTGNRTSDPLVHRPVLSPLSHTSQGLNQL